MEELKAFIITRNSKCEECDSDLFKGDFIALQKDKGGSCLTCADLDHLIFLPSGDAALTRRAKKYSRLSAVVLKFSRTRKRYERQGLLVEEDALTQAEDECINDEEERKIRRSKAAKQRAKLDHQYVSNFADRIREHYPSMPTRREKKIAEHACRKYSGRVGRSADAKEFQENAIVAAVRAHIRHVETSYDELLMTGYDRFLARDKVRGETESILKKWSKTS